MPRTIFSGPGRPAAPVHWINPVSSSREIGNPHYSVSLLAGEFMHGIYRKQLLEGERATLHSLSLGGTG